MDLTLTLLDARTLYENHFKVDMPSNLPYIEAATMVMKAVGWDTFMERYTAMKELAAKYRRFTVYEDVDAEGYCSYTVVDGGRGAIGTYLKDDPFLRDVIKAGAKCKTGIVSGRDDDLDKCDNCKCKDDAGICIIGGC